MLHKTEIQRWMVYVSRWNPESPTDVQHTVPLQLGCISMEEPIEKTGFKKTRSTKNVYVVAEVQNPQQMLKIQCSFSRGIFQQKSQKETHALWHWNQLEICICFRWTPESPKDAKDTVFVQLGYISAEEPIQQYASWNWDKSNSLYVFGKSRNPIRCSKYSVPSAGIYFRRINNRRQFSKSEINQNYVYGFADVQDPQQMLEILFSFSRGIFQQKSQ